MCKKFQKIWPHGLWDYSVWSGKESFFTLCLAIAFGANFLYYATLSFCIISMHIILGTCVPNLRDRGWVEHTQMHLVLKKGTKKFHYTSNSWGILSEFTFSLIQNSGSNFREKMEKKMKFLSYLKNGRFHVPKYTRPWPVPDCRVAWSTPTKGWWPVVGAQSKASD
jgi:hypothetical protein